MLLAITLLLIPGEITGSSPDLSVQVNDPVRLIVEADLNQDYLADLFTFTISSDSNQPLLTYILQNLTDREQVIFLQTRVLSDNHGRLITATQNKNTPIVLNAGETIRFTNLDIINNSVPGTGGEVHFNFILNSTARTVLRRLLEGAVPGNERFVIETTINGTETDITASNESAAHQLELLTSIPQEALQVGAAGDEEDADVIERQHVDVIGGRTAFSWAGRENIPYRLVVVRDTQQNDAGSLIENRFDQPFSESASGNLQNDVVLDIEVQNNEYEATGDIARYIEPGYRYAWQVRGMLPTTSGDVEIASGIRSFTTGLSVEEELYDLLVRFFGADRANQMREEGLELHHLEIDGVTYTAKEAVEYLNNILEKIEQNRATIGS